MIQRVSLTFAIEYDDDDVAADPAELLLEVFLEQIEKGLIESMIVISEIEDYTIPIED